MTNELAIRIITGDVLGTKEQTQEAITMAVKALSLPSAQSNLQQTCNKLATDTISRQEAIDLVRDVCNVVMSGCNSHYDSEIGGEIYDDILEVNAILKCNKQVKIALRNMPSAQPDNQINLCDSCDYSYPDCPSKNDDVIFGNGIGNDNICACNKYKPSAQPEPYLDSIVSEIENTISETKKSGRHHEIHIRTNGEMICYGLQLALEIIEEKRNGQTT